MNPDRENLSASGMTLRPGDHPVPPPPTLLRRLAAHRQIFALVLGERFPVELGRARARVSGQMWVLGSGNPFVAALDLARSLSGREETRVPMLLLAALDLCEAERELSAAVTATQAAGAASRLRTPFVEALRNGTPLDALQPLVDQIDAQGLINRANGIGLTAAMLAAAFGRLDVLGALEARGAALDAINPHTGENVLHYAALASSGGEAIERYVLERCPALGASDQALPADSSSPLDAAADRGDVVVPISRKKGDGRADEPKG